MTIINTGVGKVTGIVNSTDNAVMTFDGVSGEQAQETSVTIDDAGTLTAAAFVGDGSGLTSIPGGSGSGDVAGPLVSIDNHVVRWDGITGKLVQDNGVVTISDLGACLGMTSLAVDNVFINGQVVEAAINTNMIVQASGNGSVTLNGGNFGLEFNGQAFFNDDIFVTAGENLKLYSGNITIDSGNIIVDQGYIDLDGVMYINKEAVAGITISHRSDTAKTIQEYRTTGGIRKGWLGYGTGATNAWTMRNEHSDGDINFHPRDGDGTGSVDIEGWTRLGSDNAAPKIKMAHYTGTTSSSSTGAVQRGHGLTGGTIIGIQAIVRHATNQGITAGYEAGGGGYDYDVWYSATEIHIVNNGGNITSKPYSILITYIN